MNWHATDIDSIARELQTDPLRGLTPAEAQERLARHGANELAKGHRASPAQLFFGQFKNTLIVILLAATVLSALLGEIVDAAIISLIVRVLRGPRIRPGVPGRARARCPDAHAGPDDRRAARRC